MYKDAYTILKTFFIPVNTFTKIIWKNSKY